MKIVSKKGKWPFPSTKSEPTAEPPSNALTDEEEDLSEVLHRTTNGVDMDFEVDIGYIDFEIDFGDQDLGFK